MQTERAAKKDPELSNKLQLRDNDVKELVFKQMTEIPPNVTKEQVFEMLMWTMKSDLSNWRKCQHLAFTYGEQERNEKRLILNIREESEFEKKFGIEKRIYSLLY